MFDANRAVVWPWLRKYESMGVEAFTLKGNKKYSKELKQQAVLDYLAGCGSQNDICKKYGILQNVLKLQIIFLCIYIIPSAIKICNKFACKYTANILLLTEIFAQKKVQISIFCS